MRPCPHCQREIFDAAFECIYCGKDVRQDAPPLAWPASSPPPPPPPASREPSPPPSSTPQRTPPAAPRRTPPPAPPRQTPPPPPPRRTSSRPSRAEEPAAETIWITPEQIGQQPESVPRSSPPESAPSWPQGPPEEPPLAPEVQWAEAEATASHPPPPPPFAGLPTPGTMRRPPPDPDGFQSAILQAGGGTVTVTDFDVRMGANAIPLDEIKRVRVTQRSGALAGCGCVAFLVGSFIAFAMELPSVAIVAVLVILAMGAKGKNTLKLEMQDGTERDLLHDLSKERVQALAVAITRALAERRRS